MMDVDHTGHDRPKHKNPKYFYDTPFALIAFMLALLMIVPMSGRISPMPDARADTVADGVCSQICTPFCITVDGNTSCNGQFCQGDLNDPDCLLPIASTCYCNDGNEFDIQGFPDATKCNANTTCGSHDGWVESLVSSVCACADGSVHTLAEPSPAYSACTSTCLVNGGWKGDVDLQIDGCREGVEFFYPGDGTDATCSRTVSGADPDTGASSVSVPRISAKSQLGALENRAINEVLAEHGLPATDRSLVLTWARDRVRAQILTNFINIIQNTARTDEEQVLYDWLTYLVWQKRINAAQFSWDQYRAWLYAVNFAKCDWHSPNKDGIVTLTANGNKSEPGCSPGFDGIPGTDPTPNVGSIQDVLAGPDDGETCFTYNNFQRDPGISTFTPYYDALTLARCAGVPVQWQVGLAAHPTVEEFLEYGLALARKNEIITPGFASTLGNTYKDEAFLYGIGISGIAAIGTGAVVYKAGGWAAYTTKIAPFLNRVPKLAQDATKATVRAVGQATRAAGRIASAIAAATIVLEVIANTVTAVLTLLDIIEFNAIPIKLKEVVRAAAGTTETGVKISEKYTFTTGKPNLQTLITTDKGKDEIRFVLVEAMSPEKDLSTATAPLPDPNQFWAQKQQSGTPVTASPLTHSLLVTAWDGSKPFEKQLIGLYGGWFTSEVTISTGSTGEVVRRLDLGLDYKDCDGKERRVWRVGGNEFVSMPMGTTAADFDLTKATKTKEFQYLSYDQNLGCLTARINHAPTSTGISYSGTPTEGQSLTFTGIVSDPNGDTMNLAWDFDDDGSTATGSPVQHTFVDNGSFQATLTPTDSFGLLGAAKTQSVDIANALPVVTAPAAPADKTVDEGEHISFALGSFNDAGTADKPWAVEVDWGDGSPHTTFNREAQGALPNTGHTYADGPHSYPVTVTVKDKDNGSDAKQTFTVTVNNVAPNGGFFLPTSSVSEGSSFSFSFSNILGLDPSPVDSQSLQYAFDCGTVAGFGAYGSTNSITCPTADNGTRTIRGQIKDKDGGANEQSTTMEVTNVAPTATFTAPVQAFTGESAILAFSQQFDPSAADTTAGFTYAYDCTTNGTLTVANNQAATATCKYLTTGTFTTSGTIKDKDQGTTSYTASVTVIAPQQAATNLRTQVVALNLDAARTSDLTTKIDNALQKLAQGKKAEASKQLQDFIKKVKDIVEQKVLTSAQGKALTDVANRIIASIAAS